VPLRWGWSTQPRVLSEIGITGPTLGLALGPFPVNRTLPARLGPDAIATARRRWLAFVARSRMRPASGMSAEHHTCRFS